jgi:outer membrane protein assembly factor BamB
LLRCASAERLRANLPPEVHWPGTHSVSCGLDPSCANDLAQAASVRTVPVGSTIDGQVSVADGAVYAGDSGGDVSALDAVTGTYKVAPGTGGNVVARLWWPMGCCASAAKTAPCTLLRPAGAAALRWSEKAPPLSSLDPDMRVVLME